MSATIIKPKSSVFNPQKRGNTIRNTLTATAKGIKVDFDVTTQTWKHRSVFTITSGARFQREISTDDPIYAMLDAGTKAHEIRPKKPRGILRFKTPFQSKTLPNQIMSRGGSTGNNQVVARVVRHPGTKPRNWAKAIQKKWQAQIGPIFQRAIDGAA